MQWLCAAYIQQDTKKQRHVAPPQGIPVGHETNSNQPPQPAVQALPKAPCSPQPVIQPLGSSGLEAPSPAPCQENVLVKDQTQVADLPASSSNQVAAAPIGDLKNSASTRSGLTSLQIASKEPVFEADIQSPVRNKLKLRSSHLGELWFYPEEDYHTYRLRTALTKEEPFSRFSLQMLIDSNAYLDEHGEMPEPVASSGIPVAKIPKGEEEEDPPAKWTAPEALIGDEHEMWVHSKRTLYAWLRSGTQWARFYVGVHDMGLIEIDDPVNCAVTEIHEKYAVIDGSVIHYSETGSRSSPNRVTTSSRKKTQPRKKSGTSPL